MTFFTQSAKFTMHNKETLTAVQVAEDVVGKIRDSKSINLEGFASCSAEDPNIICKEKEDYFTYRVEILEKKGPVEKYLKRAEITVESDPNSSIKSTPFTTEIYFEVTP